MAGISLNCWKRFYQVIFLIPFFYPFFSFSQPKEELSKQIVSLKLIYLSRESVRNTYLDKNGIEHPVFNSKQDAYQHINQVYKEISDVNDLAVKSIPNVFFIWKDENEFWDEKNEESIFFDLEKDSVCDQPLKK